MIPKPVDEAVNLYRRQAWIGLLPGVFWAIHPNEYLKPIRIPYFVVHFRKLVANQPKFESSVVLLACKDHAFTAEFVIDIPAPNRSSLVQAAESTD